VVVSRARVSQFHLWPQRFGASGKEDAMRRRRISDQVTRLVLSESLQRCVVPSCRTRLTLRLVELAPGPMVCGRYAPLCQECRARLQRGEFNTYQLQRWKLRGMDYWENVGAE
jgi:hypothetical protein